MAVILRCQVCSAVAWQGGTITEEGEVVGLPTVSATRPDSSTQLIDGLAVLNAFADVACPRGGQGCPYTKAGLAAAVLQLPATQAALQDAQTLINTAQQQIVELRTITDAIKPIADRAGGEHQSFRDADTALTARIEQVSARSEQIGSRGEQLGQRAEQIGAAVDALSSRVEQVGTRGEQIDTRVEQVTSTHDAQLTTHASQIAANTSQISTNTAQIATHTNQINTQSGQVGSINTQLTSLTGRTPAVRVSRAQAFAALALNATRSMTFTWPTPMPSSTYEVTLGDERIVIAATTSKTAAAVTLTVRATVAITVTTIFAVAAGW